MKLHQSISICIPNYNHGRVVKKTIISALAQQSDNIEVIVSDNASTDDSHAVYQSFHGAHNLRIIHQPYTLPMTAHWNIFSSQAKGDWVLMLSSDDILLPDFYVKIAPILSSDVDAIFFEYDYLYDRDGERVSKVPFYNHDAVIDAAQQFRIFLKGNNFPLSVCLVRRELMDRIGWFNQTFNFCSDWHAWLDITSQARKVAYIKSPLLLYRIHAQNETNRCVRNGSALREIIKMKSHFINQAKEISDADRYASIRNSLKLAEHYLAEVSECGDEVRIIDYQQQIVALQEELAALDVPVNKSAMSGPPYPLPPASSIVEFSGNKASDLCSISV